MKKYLIMIWKMKIKNSLIINGLKVQKVIRIKEEM